jgi:hypothetical protein
LVEGGGDFAEGLEGFELLLRAIAWEAELGRAYPVYFFLSDFMEEWYILRFIMKRDAEKGFMRGSLGEREKEGL